MYVKYIEAAVNHRECELFDDDGLYYCDIPVLPGVWAQGVDTNACVEELREVLVDWIQIGLELGHQIPAIDGLAPTAS